MRLLGGSLIKPNEVIGFFKDTNGISWGPKYSNWANRVFRGPLGQPKEVTTSPMGSLWSPMRSLEGSMKPLDGSL